SRGLFVTLFLLVIAEIALGVARHSFELPWLSGALAAVTTALGIAVYIVLQVMLLRIRKPETLDIGRRGLLITRKDAVPVALAWRMIRDAVFETGSPQRWRFALKSGGEMTLSQGDFSQEQWKKFSEQLDRKLRARKITV